MEWCEVEDLVVPNDYEQTQMISSPENWSQWGMPDFVNSSFSKNNFNSNSNTSTDIEDSDNQTSKSNNSSMSQELYNNGGSLLWHDEADFRQFEARINHMDDILFSSLLEEDPTTDSKEPYDSTILAKNANVFEGKMVNSQYVGDGEVSTTYQTPKQYISNENMDESILNDFERVTAQFTHKTRICFRDALCRLAESSKQSFNSCQDGESMMASIDDTLKDGEAEDSESKTNVIDRVVASLMFHKFDFEGKCSQHK